MVTMLKEVNSVLGVTGSFVCTVEGQLIESALPVNVSEQQAALAGRVAAQTLQALNLSGQRATEMDLLYSQGRLIIKSLRGGILVILCARNISLPLLNLTCSVAVKKIAAELKGGKGTGDASADDGAGEPVAEPAKARAATRMAPKPAPASTPKAAPAQAAPAPPADSVEVNLAGAPAIYADLYREMNRIQEQARASWMELRVMDGFAVWICTEPYRAILTPPVKRELVFAARSWRISDANTISSLFSQLGYASDSRANSGRRLVFTHKQMDTSVMVHVDQMEMYHRLNLTSYFGEGRTMLPETGLLLAHLQLVEIGDAALRDLCALFLQCDFSVGREKGKLNAAEITQICSEDWGWFKTVSLNLERVLQVAPAVCKPADLIRLRERIQALKTGIAQAPKNLRWQTRSRLGESVKWYDTPAWVSPGHRAG